jgi:hypothetical protein
MGYLMRRHDQPIFYPVILEIEEENLAKLSLHDQYDVRLGPSPRFARLPHAFTIHKEKSHVPFPQAYC